MLRKTKAVLIAALMCVPYGHLHAEGDDGITIGGAVRFQYIFEDYNDGSKATGGKMEFDTFRLDLNGSIGDVILSAQWRYYTYMQVIHSAWVGYDLNPSWQVRAGIQQVPFGNLPFNSHNFFFSTAYYVGLEDDYNFGIVFEGDLGPLDLHLGFFKNDELGGVNGFSGSRADSYSYNVVASDLVGGDLVDELGEGNTGSVRLAYNLEHGGGATSQFGISGQYGWLYGLNQTPTVGDHWAAAVHFNGQYGPLNIMLQALTYEYDLKDNSEVITVGAYSFFDQIPTEAEIYTANLAYALPVTFGPVTGVTLYNNYNLMSGKSADLRRTFMNVTGFSVAAGGIFAYFDYILAENQPFVGGTMVGGDTSFNSRFNINVGYYF